MGTPLSLVSRSAGSRALVIRAWAAALTEAGLAGIATGLLALHVADDNFLQPQPGTSAADHLVSGLVPLALLVAFVVRYRRLRAGTRAAIAVATGSFGIAAGVGEAGYYTLALGPSGDDYTGLLAIPAGLLLVCAGATTLWRTRRLGNRLAWRYGRRLLLAVAAVASAYFVAAPLALTYVFTHAARAHVPTARLGAAYEKVSFKTADGLTLHGWYVPSKNRAAVISAPGRADSQRPARMLVRHGYGVLLFDRRGEGESDGDPHIFGWGAEKDLNAAVAFLQRRADVDRARIGGIGLSVGGETLLQAAAESDGLKAVVSDGAGSRSIREDLARPGTSKWEEVPTSLVMTVGNMLFSNQAPPPELGRIVSRIAPRPVLFIYGEHDQANVVDLTPRYYAKAGRPKALWRVPGASHTGGIDAHPREYERRVVAFLDNALLQQKGTP
jgi:alpha/beta superfamily hydrolase